MRHVFVETNWLHDYAAPAHHKVPEAVTLLERAERGEFILHIPNASFVEARQSIQVKCQPVDGPGVHRYIRWAYKNGELNDEQANEAHQLADRYVQGINRELFAVPAILQKVAALPYVKVFALDDEMLDLANQLAFTRVAQKPFDHAILAGILVSCSRNCGTKVSAGRCSPSLIATCNRGARKERPRTIYASYTTTPTSGFMEISLYNFLHVILTLNSARFHAAV